MTDPSFQLLVQQLHQMTGPQLLVADENLGGAPLHLLPADTITLITNRYDIYNQAQSSGLNCHFNDFDFSSFGDNSFSQVLYRVSKEKPVAHHVINNSRRLLTNNGTLVLSGAKTDGIKTYTDKAARYFGTRATPEKHGSVYRGVIRHQSSTEQPLDDQDYQRLRPCIPLTSPSNDQLLYSKPGLFGWNKVDQGSAFLAEHLSDFFGRFRNTPRHILDLGCGYGYLSITARQCVEATITATDNNAAAIAACSKNFSLAGIDGEVIAGDCAENIAKTFDAVICNPPFHQGFTTDNQLTQRFVTSCHQHLKTGGMALFVVNRFVPLESCAESLFQVSKLGENKGFKLVLLEK
jgi:16S rRNA (guanine1207-N2)-methyltransferase